MLGPQDVGYRVVVRRIVGIRENRPLFSDLLGELLALDEDGVTILTKNGAQRVPHGAVQAAKRVPRSVREIARLERAGSAAWPAPDRDRLGDGELRAAQGWTARANSALPIGDPGADRAAAIEAVIGWYAARGLPARMNVPLPVCAALDAELTARGWHRSPASLVLTAPLERVLGSVAARPELPPVDLAAVPDEPWLAVVSARKGGLPRAAHQVLTGPAQVRFAAVGRHPAGIRAVARGAVVDGYLHLSLVEVVPDARRGGLARHVVRALAEWASTERVNTAFLQVEASNHPARALYARLGFTVHHEYVTRTSARAGAELRGRQTDGDWPSGSPLHT